MDLLHRTFSILKTFSTPIWIVIGATAINQLGMMALPFLLLYLVQHLHFSLTLAATVLVMYGISVVATGLVGGSLVDRFGAKNIMIVTLIGNGLVMFGFAAIHHYLTLLWMSALWGITLGLFRPASQTFISVLAPAHQQKVAFACYRLAVNLGMSVGPAAGGYLAMVSFPVIFIVNGFTNLLAGIVLIIGLWHFVMPKIPNITKKLSVSFLKSDKVLLYALLVVIPVIMVFYQHNSTLAVYLIKNLHFSYGFFGLLFTINTLIIVCFEIFLNVATTNWSYRWSLSVGSFFVTVGFFGLAFVSSKLHVIMLAVVWTIGEMILLPGFSAYIADLAPAEHRGSYLSLMNTSWNVALMLGPWWGTLIMDHTSATVLWLVCGVWGMVSVVLFTRLARK